MDHQNSLQLLTSSSYPSHSNVYTWYRHTDRHTFTPTHAHKNDTHTSTHTYIYYLHYTYYPTTDNSTPLSLLHISAPFLTLFGYTRLAYVCMEISKSLVFCCCVETNICALVVCLCFWFSMCFCFFPICWLANEPPSCIVFAVLYEGSCWSPVNTTVLLSCPICTHV